MLLIHRRKNSIRGKGEPGRGAKKNKNSEIISSAYSSIQFSVWAETIAAGNHKSG